MSEDHAAFEAVVQEAIRRQRLDRWNRRLRLLTALAVAPLPLLLLPSTSEWAFTSYAISCVSLFALVLLFRSEYLPGLNLALTPVLAAICLGGLRNTDSLLALAVWGGLYVVLRIVMILCGLQTGKVRCLWVLYSAVLPYAIFIVSVVRLVRVNPVLPSPNEIIAENLIHVVWGLTLVFSLYFAGTDPGETLEERPDLGWRYQASMVAIPYAALFVYLHYVEGFLP